MDIDTIFWSLSDGVYKSINDVRFELESINWSLSLSCVGLHSSCHKTLWEEEC